MEDTIVKPGLYAYQFRVDLDIDLGLTKVMEFMTKYKVQYYICGAEISDLGKHHFQCILWFKEKQNTTKLRNWWAGKADTTRQPVSMTSAKKIKNLAMYTMKEGNFTTNLKEDEVKAIGKWKKRLADAEWADRLEEHAKAYDKTWEDAAKQHYANFKFDDKSEDEEIFYYRSEKIEGFICYLLEFYRKNHRRPTRATLVHIAWKHGYLTNNYLYNQWFRVYN